MAKSSPSFVVARLATGGLRPWIACREDRLPPACQDMAEIGPAAAAKCEAERRNRIPTSDEIAGLVGNPYPQHVLKRFVCPRAPARFPHQYIMQGKYIADGTPFAPALLFRTQSPTTGRIIDVPIPRAEQTLSRTQQLAVDMTVDLKNYMSWLASLTAAERRFLDGQVQAPRALPSVSDLTPLEELARGSAAAGDEQADPA